MPKIEKQTAKPAAKPQRGIVDAWSYADKFSMLVYGMSGTGKTTFWATFPGPVLAIICGKRPGELQSIDNPENRKRIIARVCSTGRQIEACLEEGASGKYQTVVLDHGTSLNNVLLREELGVEQLLQNSWGTASREQYFAVALKTKEILTRLLDLDAYRIIVAQEKDHAEEVAESELLKDVQVASLGGDFSKSVIRWLNPECSYIVQTFKRPRMVTTKKEVKIAGKTKVVTETKRGKGVDFCLRCAPHDRAITKFRMNKEFTDQLPEAMVDPSYDKIAAIIRATRG